MSQYCLLDTGNRKKLEKIGDLIIIRPAPQAIWEPFNPKLWKNAESEFIRNNGEKGEWTEKLPEKWIINSEGLKWNIEPNSFGNIGIFTEHWTYTYELEKIFEVNEQILNLFSYSGSSIIKLLYKGYKATAVDSSKNAMTLYSKNMELNKINRDGQRLILEDAIKFCEREIRRDNKYGNIICDLPSFGRGSKGEIFDIDQQLVKVLQICRKLLKENGSLAITLHSPRYTLETLKIVCSQIFFEKQIEAKEILNLTESKHSLPSGYLVKIFG